MATQHSRILGVGTTYPAQTFTQREAARLLGVNTPKAQRFFDHPHIHQRHLLFEGTTFQEETATELRAKFLQHAPRLFKEAVDQALQMSRLTLDQIDYLVCVTSSAFIVPGPSALMMEKFGFRRDCQRLDIVGMGCNAGLNGLSTVNSWCLAHPGQKALMVCLELCSAIYNVDDSENSALVNSLFGDGVAALVVQSVSAQENAPEILAFTSHLIADSLTCLRFDWDKLKNKNNFFIDKKTPQILAEEINQPLKKILHTAGLELHEIKHWIVHSGGEAILSAIEKKLYLSQNEFRHTRTVLRDFGNISSGSFLFSYQRLLNEEVVKKNDYGLMITMGPGLTIEMALIRW